MTIDVPYFLARPEGEVGAGVVVVHEGNGMSPQLLRVCQRLAGEGYAVAAPDLFFRTGGAGAGDFTSQMGALDQEEVQHDLAVAAGVLRDLGVTKIGVTGFCMGGATSYRTALRAGWCDAAVGFYGAGIAKELGEPRCPTLLLFGGSDPWIPAADIEAVVAHHPDTVVYPEAGHGFMRDGSDDFAPDAAADAWSRLLAHFGRHLKEA